MLLPVIALICAWSYSDAASTTKDLTHSMQKRQIFREQVLPYLGGKIPEDAFRSDRLALNRLNSQGIAVPDGVLLESRHRESHYNSHRDDSDIRKSIIKLIQKPDGRYAPPEGRYPFNNLVESTYIIRPPSNVHHLLIPPQRPHETVLRLPAKPFFEAEDEEPLNNVENSFEIANPYNPELPSGPKYWNSFGNIFDDLTNRILRHTRRDDATNGRHPNLNKVPRTDFRCPQVKLFAMMFPDNKANCQAFHLCHVDGTKESFLCPQGMRFKAETRQCVPWTQVYCPHQS